jgi:hypothetical protein
MRADIGSAKRPDQVPPDGTEPAVGVDSGGDSWFFGDDALDMGQSKVGRLAPRVPLAENSLSEVEIRRTRRSCIAAGKSGTAGMMLACRFRYAGNYKAKGGVSRAA